VAGDARVDGEWKMPPHSFGQLFVRLAAVSVACAAVLAAIGYVPTIRVVGVGGTVSMLAGIGTSLIAGLLGALATCQAISQGGAKTPVWILMGTTVRFLAVLLLVVPIALSGLVDRKAYVVWVAITYLVLLLVDTLISVPGLRAPREERL